TALLALGITVLFLRASPKDDAPALQPTHLDNVNTEMDEDDPHLSSDGLRLFYTSRGHGKSEVMEASRKSRRRSWSAGQPMLDLNDQGDCRGVFLTPEEDYPQHLFFATNRDPDQKNGRGDNFDIYYLIKQRAKADFTTLTPIQAIATQADEMYPWLTADSKKLYFSRKDNDGWHLYVSPKPAKSPFEKPSIVDLPPGFHHATLTPDGRTMYLQGPLGGERWGLFRSTWAAGQWSPPEPLSRLNNSDGRIGDLSPCLSRDGLKLYFASDRPGGKGGLDLWVISTAELARKN